MKELQAFYFNPLTEVYCAVFEDGHIEKGVTSTPLVDGITTIPIEDRIVINLHQNECAFSVNYYRIEEGSKASVYNGQDYYCDVTITK